MSTHIRKTRAAGLLDYIKAWPQYLLPHYALSNLMHALTRSKIKWWKNAFIHWFIGQFKINMDEASPSDPKQYSCINEFFTRPLKADARPLNINPERILCPVDGAISQLGDIETHRVFQAKGRSFTIDELLGGDKHWSDTFTDGQFATLYLSPKDYHRIHMPVRGRLLQMTYIPGRLFSVNPATTRAIPRLFARNERVVTVFETDYGPMALVLVGAIFVASMETVWHGVITPPHRHNTQQWNYTTGDHDNPGNPGEQNPPVNLEQGAEMGRFNMGSTVILLFPKNSMLWNGLESGQSVKLGQEMGVRSITPA